MSAIYNRLVNDKSLLECTIPLSAISQLRNGYAFKSTSYCDEGKYKILTISNVLGRRFVDVNKCNTIEHTPIDIQGHQILKDNDILISLTGNVGRVSMNIGKYNLLNQRVGLLQLNPYVNNEFIFQMLSFSAFEREMINRAQGAAQMNIGKSDVESYVIPYSHTSHNLVLVSSILKTMDIRIENAIALLSHLSQQKKGLLSQLFI